MSDPPAELPRFVTVIDQLAPCTYRAGQLKRLPCRRPLAKLTREAFDRLLDEGDRRHGPILYRPTCPACTSCEAIRVPIARFVPTASQRAAVRKNRDLQVRVVPPEVTARHLELYNRHKQERGLAQGGGLTDAAGYRGFLGSSCVETVEVRYELDGLLIAVSILDLGRSSASSVYHFFDPDHAWRSLGVFSVLAELELCAGLGLEWYYLGLWVEDCKALSYKAAYRPHQRLSGGVWRELGAT